MVIFRLFLDFFRFMDQMNFFKIGHAFKVSSTPSYTFNTIYTIFSHKIRATKIQSINQTKNYIQIASIFRTTTNKNKRATQFVLILDRG